MKNEGDSLHRQKTTAVTIRSFDFTGRNLSVFDES